LFWIYNCRKMKFVLVEKNNRVGVITLNRPDKRNALNAEFVAELSKAFKDFAKDEEVKVIILRANGEVFSAGADLKYLQDLQQNSYNENLQDSINLKNLYLQIYQLDKVVIAEVGGHAIAGGCGLITACDFVFAANEAKFGYTEVKIGFIPAIVMVFLLRKLSETHAKELLLSGFLINAQKAVEMSLITQIVEKKELRKFVESYAQDLVRSNSAASMGLTKTMIAKVQGMDIDQAMDLATKTNATVRESDDCKRGIEAFLNGEQIFW